MFKENRALFYGNSYSNIIANLRDMESDFGVIPTPKLDEKQENYYSYINTYVLGGIGIPVNCKDVDMVGLTSEALCYESYRIVRPALYETVMKVKVTRDDIDAQILDIIFNSTYVDLNGIYNFGDSLSVLTASIFNGKDFASAYSGITEKIKADIDAILSAS